MKMRFYISELALELENGRFAFLLIRSDSVRNRPIRYRFGSVGQNKWIDVLTGPSVYYGPVLM